MAPGVVGGQSPAGLLVPWLGASVRTWGSQVGTASWGVGSFSGLVVRGRACGRSLRANASKVGYYICPTSGTSA